MYHTMTKKNLTIWLMIDEIKNSIFVILSKW